MTWITLNSGKRLDFINPDAEAIDIERVAISLSRTGRWANQTNDFYSVAQHSVIVSQYVKERGGSRLDQFVGLLHDAPEAYIGDITRPFKQMLGEKFHAVESALWQCFSIKVLGEFVPMPSIVKYCDDLALATEARDLFTQNPTNGWDYDLPAPDTRSIVPLGMKQAAVMFLSRFLLLAWGMPEISVE